MSRTQSEGLPPHAHLSAEFVPRLRTTTKDTNKPPLRSREPYAMTRSATMPTSFAGFDPDVVPFEEVVPGFMAPDEAQMTQELASLREQTQQQDKKVKSLEDRLTTDLRLKEEAEKGLEMKKKQWAEEREAIIRQHGGRLPEQIAQLDKVKADSQQLRNKNEALKACMQAISSQYREQLKGIQHQLKTEKAIAEQTESHNQELKERVQELREEKKQLEHDLTEEKEKESIGEPAAPADGMSKVYLEYPPESTVIQNLLQAQVEFYFSDYNLKRDKRLLQDVVAEPKGFLKLEDVMKLSRIRQLCSEEQQLVEALKRSKILTLRHGDDLPRALVGRPHFEKPREKEFPFRRTVFIFGIPEGKAESFLHEMLRPFGNVNKIQFDHGPDTLDRTIGNRFLVRPRVYKLYRPGSDGDERKPMDFKTAHTHEQVNQIQCFKCNKQKPVEEGFYVTPDWRDIYCAQCAAGIAEEQLNAFYAHKYEHRRDYYLGSPPEAGSETAGHATHKRTALVVFASQRQASKCAYVRSRISHEGAFATHYHHYSKVKKEIALSQQQSSRGGGYGHVRHMDRGMDDDFSSGGRDMLNTDPTVPRGADPGMVRRQHNPRHHHRGGYQPHVVQHRHPHVMRHHPHHRMGPHHHQGGRGMRGYHRPPVAPRHHHHPHPHHPPPQQQQHGAPPPGPTHPRIAYQMETADHLPAEVDRLQQRQAVAAQQQAPAAAAPLVQPRLDIIARPIGKAPRFMRQRSSPG